ncbi:DUF5818 domain-containing protein [Pseudonocardia sp. TMWB2A]|uniref:DUF5818 domain-containing protein n=1 Tax=Pseudonocardia sp. TMWB2A TaxID=687430 RepID=UPI00307F2E25
MIRQEPRRIIINVHGGGTWELEPSRLVTRHIDQSVTLEGVRTGYDRVEVVRIKRDGEDWPPEQSWTKWFERWRQQ